MSFLNTLVNIGTTIGKVLTSIFGGKNIVSENGMRYQIGLQQIADIAFVLREDNEIYVCNTNPVVDYVITFPGENGEEGEVVWLRHLEQAPITNWFNEKNTSHRKLYISQSEDTSKSQDNADLPSMMNLSFNRLRINGDPVTLGGFKISVAEQSGIKGVNIECKNAMGLQNLRTCTMVNDNGVSLYSGDYIAPNNNVTEGEEKRFYPLDYTQHGLQNGDYVSGVINVEIQDNNVLSANCTISKKTLPADIRNSIMHHE